MLMEVFGSRMDQETLIVIISIVGAVAIVGTLVAGAVAIAKVVVRHRERMAAIGMGIDPDRQSAAGAPPMQNPPPSHNDSLR